MDMLIQSCKSGWVGLKTLDIWYIYIYDLYIITTDTEKASKDSHKCLENGKAS